ncbi:MAG: hypothetical protein LBF75_07735, partial [Treponema sp.]|nr:hypothetical protein [Treponema sp.]
MACGSQEPALQKGAAPTQADLSYTKDGVPLDDALADMARYYIGNLPAHTKIALLNFETEAPLLSDYIFEELWIHCENSRSFVLVERQHLELIQKEMEYQHSGNVRDESVQSIGNQFGPQTLI